MSAPTLGDAVAQNLLQRFAELGILDRQPLIPLAKPAVSAATPSIPNVVRVNSEMERKLMEEAIANQRHYLAQAAQTGKPWFHHPKNVFQYSEFVLTTTEMAEELEKHNVDNRNKSMPYIEALARDMLNGRWLQTEESLGVDLYGTFYNGQHRSAAVILAAKMAEKEGKPFNGVPLYYTFQVPPSARYVEDSGRKRSAKQKLEYLGMKLTNQTTAVLRAMMEGAIRKGRRVTDSELGSFLMIHKEAVDWATKAMPATRSDVQAAFAKAALWYGTEKLEAFCDRFRKVTFTKESDPANALYRYLNKIKHKPGIEGVVVYCKTVAAIDAFIHERPMSKIYEKGKDFFDWMPGWEVPAKS